MNHPSMPALMDVEIRRDLVYGEGAIGYGGPAPGVRPLTLDVYAPTGATTGGLRPALVLSHRGAKDHDIFEQDGSKNTPVHDYCRYFAARGYVCFSVGYRLTQELAAPQALPIKRDRRSVNRGRIDHVRQLMGLPPATDAELVNGVEGAISDVASAFRFVHGQAGRWGIDPHRMAIGGFSAGAFSSVYATLALGVPAAAIVSLSGGMEADDAGYYVHGGRGQPPMLLVSSEFDLPGIRDRSLNLSVRAEQMGLGVRQYFVPGKPHFYDRETPVVLEKSTLPGARSGCTLGDAIEDFLLEALQPASVNEDALEAFAQAWNRHDIEALMSHMSDDCMFHGFTGGEACGASHIGATAVRAAFARAWADFPDAQWTRARHFVNGPRGVSEWTFTGTRAADGVRVEVDGCDLFTFKGNKIRVKDSWRKLRD